MKKKNFIVIESPFADDEVTNIMYLELCIWHSISQGETPFASHGFYTNFLDDLDPWQRKIGIRMGLEIASHAYKTALYTDLGVSRGMLIGELDAQEMGRPVERRAMFEFGRIPTRGEITERLCKIKVECEEKTMGNV